jgi:hypothetical protein
MEYRILKNFPDMHRLERDIFISKTNERQTQKKPPKAEASDSAALPEAADLTAAEGRE